MRVWKAVSYTHLDVYKRQVEGVMSLCIYSGKDSGYEEKEAVLTYLKGVDPRKWLVIVHQFYNRENDPPIPVFLIRLK